MIILPSFNSRNSKNSKDKINLKIFCQVLSISRIKPRFIYQFPYKKDLNDLSSTILI